VSVAGPLPVTVAYVSTYSTYQGAVSLGPAAADAFAETTSWQWFGDEPDDGIVVVRPADGSVVLEFGGASHRNLCRYLDVDLAFAQQFGDVHGALTSDCQDGDHLRTVTFYQGREVFVGFGQCFHLPVDASLGEVVTLAPSDLHGGIVALLPVGLAGVLADGVEFRPGTPAPNTMTLTGVPPVDSCGCGGWDEDSDEAACVNT
jgi:hypothetical protein